MTVIAQDPSVRVRGSIVMAKISVPAEALIAGPIGYRVHVIDYDSSSGRFHGAYDLPESYAAEPEIWTSGDPAIVGDYRFHAQNVYALVMKTLGRFEFALGRRIPWAFKTHQLKVAPHGMLDANAFYGRQQEGLVFGYFVGRHGENVYTCLSHDIVVHETAHALIDALRERYLDPSSPDQAALHEGLADVIALLSVFSQPELLRTLLVKESTGPAAPNTIDRRYLVPDALKTSALFGLAEQMGEETQDIRGSALRHSAKIPADVRILDAPEFLEEHRRGEVFVAAVMNGFIDAWAARIRAIAVPEQSRFSVGAVADEGAAIADALVTMWIRALDYMPAVHVEFHDALSAALTADTEVRPDDARYDLRRHMRDAFARYGISPAPTSRPDGCWKPAPTARLHYERLRFESLQEDKDEVFRFLWENGVALGIRMEAYTEVLSVRPCTRVGPDGFTLHETVAEYYQVARLSPDELRENGITVPKPYEAALREAQLAKRAGDHDSDGEDVDRDVEVRGALTAVYGGGMLIFDEYGRLKYHVHNHVFGRAQAKRLRYLWQSGQLDTGPKGGRLRAASLSAIHRLRSLDARRPPMEAW